MPATKRSDRNRTAEARALLADIDAWCARTDTEAGHIGAILFRHPGFVGLLRKRLQVTCEKEAMVRDLLTSNPEGASHLPAPSPHVHPKRGAKLAQRRLGAAGRAAPCQKCGGSAVCAYPSCPLREAA